MTYKATVSWGKVTEKFKVADCDYGTDWAEVRAISHFLYLHPTKFEKQLNCKGSFRERAEVARKLGLTVVLKGGRR